MDYILFTEVQLKSIINYYFTWSLKKLLSYIIKMVKKVEFYCK